MGREVLRLVAEEEHLMGPLPVLDWHIANLNKIAYSDATLISLYHTILVLTYHVCSCRSNKNKSTHGTQTPLIEISFRRTYVLEYSLESKQTRTNELTVSANARRKKARRCQSRTW